MYDIVFINPPNHCKEDYIPLGLRNLYTIITDAGYHADFIDLQKKFIIGELGFTADSREKIDTIISQIEAKIVAFTVWNTSFPWVIHMCEFIKKLNPRITTIIGGPLSTLASEQILNDYDCIDIACRFEGEMIIQPLVNAVLSRGITRMETILNIAYRTPEGAVHSTKDAPLIDNLDTLPTIDVNPVDFKSPVINLEAGRGCSFHCYYCSSCVLWKFKPRYKSGARLFSEINHLCTLYKNAGLNPPVFHLEHDNFLMKPSVLVEFDKHVQETGLEFKYGFAGRADLITEKNLTLLKRTGCFYAYLGIETGSERMQKIIRKNLSINTVFSAVRNIQNHGILVNANLMYGFPEETLDDLYDTLSLITTLRYMGVTVRISMLGPELKTPVCEAALLSDYLFNDASPYVTELTLCGFKPEEYNKIYVNHLYTLKNSHYDILLYNKFIQFWHTLVSDYPMTVNAFMQHPDFDWNLLFTRWNDRIKTKDAPETPPDQGSDLFTLFMEYPRQNAKEVEITRIEHHLAVKKQRPNSPDLSREHMLEYYRHYSHVRENTLEKLDAYAITG
ncbi:MAG: B12-binding domain-containing radical SAM protein [Proteobacteria bacterium]|nr:B12-binding domain-containing radical SAM protein [Pseudomonadota bacterium]